MNQKVEITNSSNRLICLFVLIIAMNTCALTCFQDFDNKRSDAELEQAKKQYTLDSLRYEQAKNQYALDSMWYEHMLKFTTQYKDLKNREIRTDSLMRVDTKEQTEVMKKQYELDLSKKNEYVNAMRRLSGGR